jgi:hypothetical protein
MRGHPGQVTPRHGEIIAKADPAAQRCRREDAQPDRRMRPLDRLRCYLDVSEVEELALEGDGLAGKGAANRGRIPVLDEEVLRQPNVIKPVVLAPCDLIEDFAVEPVGGLSPLLRISEVVLETKAYFRLS